MSNQIGKLQTLNGGISTISKKLGPPNSFAWGRSIDFRSDPAQQTTYPQTKKISGSIVTDLPMFADIAQTKLYLHGNTGSIYSVNTSDVVTKEYTVPDSSGNGIVYFAETGSLYIPTNTSITRRANAIGVGNYYDNFIETSGGTPTNIEALLLVAASSQSATRADTPSLSLTGDMTLEAYLKPTSLPTGTNKMSIISKWDETTSAGKLSYKLDIITTSASFGNGLDGSFTISADTSDSPIDSACTGTAGTDTLSATNAAFAPDQVVLIHQSQGTNAGQYEQRTIQSYTAGTITLTENLSGSYTTGAQVLVLKQYTDITVNTGKTWTAKAWNGTTGGILAFLANGTLTVTGTLNGVGRGFRGGPGAGTTTTGNSGESGVGIGGGSNAANGSGGGGGDVLGGVGQGGTTSGSSDLTTMLMGGGGGGTNVSSGQTTVDGANGGAIGLFIAANITGTGTVNFNGANSNVGWNVGGAGAGGSILLKAQVATFTGLIITATGGTTSASGNRSSGGGGGNGTAGGTATSSSGGMGGNGRIVVDYSNSVTGTTTPTVNTILDTSLAVANGYALRLYISSDGSTHESYTQNIDDFTGHYKFYSVSWEASISTANFYENGQLLGTKVGTATAIDDNASIFAIGCYENSTGTKTGFFDGLVDDVRIWATVRTPQQISNYYNQILSGAENNLVAYYPFDGAATDVQVSGNNDLTLNNSPTYSSDVAFKGVTTRGDEDVFLNNTGNTYTLGTALSESTHDKIPFVPTKEPFKSLALDIDTIGTGDWTVTVHDELNDLIATITVANADLQTGVYEFKFASSERIVLNASYHIHVYDTTGDGKIVTGTADQLDTAYLKTYFQILVNDIYHQAVQFQNFVCIANERYLAILQAGNVYTPHRLIFPSGYRIRSLAFWQQYLVIGMWFGQNITDTDTGKLFFWDGESDTYIDELDIPQGGINAMIGTQGGLLISAGYKGAMLEYTGYPSSFRYTARTSAQLAFRLPNVVEGDMVEIAPGALTMWNAINRIGISLNTNSTTIHQGIYSYGQYTDQDPPSVGFDNPLSIGDTTSDMVKIGCLFTRNEKLYVGFQNNNTFGIDVISEDADPYPTGTVEFLITDFGSVAAKKLPFTFRRDFEPLVDGQSVSLKWKPDRASDWVPLMTQDNAGATNVRATINQRIHEAQFATDWVNTDKSVVFTQTTLESETAEDERGA